MVDADIPDRYSVAMIVSLKSFSYSHKRVYFALLDSADPADGGHTTIGLPTFRSMANMLYGHQVNSWGDVILRVSA